MRRAGNYQNSWREAKIRTNVVRCQIMLVSDRIRGQGTAVGHVRSSVRFSDCSF